MYAHGDTKPPSSAHLLTVKFSIANRSGSSQQCSDTIDRNEMYFHSVCTFDVYRIYFVLYPIPFRSVSILVHSCSDFIPFRSFSTLPLNNVCITYCHFSCNTHSPLSCLFSRAHLMHELGIQREIPAIYSYHFVEACNTSLAIRINRNFYWLLTILLLLHTHTQTYLQQYLL